MVDWVDARTQSEAAREIVTYTHFIGIDIAKESFDAATHGAAAKPLRFQNSGEGFAAFAEAFATQLASAFVVVEATGGYEAALLAFLLARGIAVHRADPLTAKHFIRSLRKHAKTDKLDAAALARYGAERHATLALFTSKDEAQEQLGALLSRRQDLVLMRAAESARLAHPRYAKLKASLNAMIKALDGQIAAIEDEIGRILRQSKALAAKVAVMTGLTGIGQKTAALLAGFMPELGTLTRRKAASLAGCAPHPRDSGAFKGYRATTGGRAAVKRALFMAALSARKSNPALRAFYERLVQKGKKPMTAMTAVMRKLIVILNAMLRDAQPQITW
jgi:transposase